MYVQYWQKKNEIYYFQVSTLPIYALFNVCIL